MKVKNKKMHHVCKKTSDKHRWGDLIIKIKVTNSKENYKREKKIKQKVKSKDFYNKIQK
jgi:hypothetical protein